MALSLRLRGNVWQIMGTINGNLIRKSTGFTKEQQKEAYAAKLRFEGETLMAIAAASPASASGVAAARAKIRTFNDAANSYIARPGGISRRDNGTTMMWKKEFGDKKLSEITPLMVETHRQLYMSHLSPASARRYLIVLQAILHREHKLGTMPHKVSLILPADSEGRDRPVSKDERDRLLAACTGRYECFGPFLRFLMNTGARCLEAASVTPSSFTRLDGKLQVVFSTRKGNSKKKRMRAVPIVESLERAIAPLMSGPPDQPMFRDSFGSPWIRNNGVQTAQLYREWAGLQAKAGVKDLHFHDLRHDFATRMAEASGDLDDIARILGHTNVMMAARYKSKRPAKLRSLVDSASVD